MAHLGKSEILVEKLVKIIPKKDVFWLIAAVILLALPWLLWRYTDWFKTQAQKTQKAEAAAKLSPPTTASAITFTPGETEKVIDLKGDDTPTAWVPLPPNVDFRIDPPPDGCWVELTSGRKIWSKPGEKFVIGQPIEGKLRFWGKGKVKVVIEKQNPSPTSSRRGVYSNYCRLGAAASEGL